MEHVCIWQTVLILGGAVLFLVGMGGLLCSLDCRREQRSRLRIAEHKAGLKPERPE